MLVLLSKVGPMPMEVKSCLISALDLFASFVMIFMVPPMADAPKRAEPPPLTTSTLSIISAGICSSP